MLGQNGGRSDMMISETERQKLVTGFKQTAKALAGKTVSKVYIAKDCEDRFFDKIQNLSQANGVEIIYVETMKNLGTLCGIDRGASCAGILK